ncbi:hypothetical protein Ahy_B07g086253 [Arachis hypogaea]|uniref:Uncharacterized protein n=1 Tax=Arachis hypogaea TaxID=3818 RepID=A0A444Y981_ARAHY|nr:hypothetical protein Ahy_B07g086253 [Arachis hypogaea]
MAENEKVSLQAQAPKDPTSKQPITIVEDAFEEQLRTSKKTRKAQPTALFQECTHNGNGTMFEVEKNSKTRNQRTAEPDAMDQNNINSDDDGEDTSEMSATSNKKGMSLDMYFKVHGINLEDEEDEEDEENELDDNANDAGSGGQTSNEGTFLVYFIILVHQLNPGMSNEEVTALVQAAQDSPVDTSSSKAKNTPRSSEATHIPHKDDDSRAYEYTSMKNLNESENGFWGALARKAKSICSCSFGTGQNNLPCNDDA